MSWVHIPQDSPFSIANIPFGIISSKSGTIPRPAVAIGDCALDLKEFAEHGGFKPLDMIEHHLGAFGETSLNAFAALGRAHHRLIRGYLQDVLATETMHPWILRDNESLREQALVPLSEVRSHLPMEIGDYTDFFAGKHHAYNCGIIFRGPSNALQPNYCHMPVAYHGRASSVVVSGTPIRRPSGQILENPAAEVKVPIFSPSRRLDMELELGAFICKDSSLGEPISVDQAHEHLFGFVLLNDWSARDLQAWEAVPLGPFLSKNFGTTISPWVVLADALEPFRCAGLPNDTTVLDYLNEASRENMFDIALEVELTSKRLAPISVREY
ncbi:MAG: hypothetical protein LQ340_002600 [Diploschistes diacapsis]|nr:MAG: hypothetical protein LQ340_002600 [Diploschistes diacapsis]